MCFKNPRFFYPSDPKMTPFLGSKSKKILSGLGFSPKPTPGPNFIKIGVGVRTQVLHSLLDGLLSKCHIIRCHIIRRLCIYVLSAFLVSDIIEQVNVNLGTPKNFHNMRFVILLFEICSAKELIWGPMCITTYPWRLCYQTSLQGESYQERPRLSL